MLKLVAVRPYTNPMHITGLPAILQTADRNGIADDAVSVVIPGATVYIPFAELVDIAQEIERLQKEEKRLNGEGTDITDAANRLFDQFDRFFFLFIIPVL